jgi:hypothetical protein
MGLPGQPVDQGEPGEQAAQKAETFLRVESVAVQRDGGLETPGGAGVLPVSKQTGVFHTLSIHGKGCVSMKATKHFVKILFFSLSPFLHHPGTGHTEYLWQRSAERR